VIDLLLEFETNFPNSIFLNGNHEDMFLGFLGFEGQGAHFYLPNGGVETLESYGINSREELEDALSIIPESHQQFLLDLDRIVMLDRYVIVHAGVNPLRDLKSQIDEDIYWIRDEFIQNVHYFDKTIVFGHTPYQNVFFDQPYKIGVDTGLVYGNMLSCIELGAGTVYQVAKEDSSVRVSSFGDLGGEVTGFSWGGGTGSSSAATISEDAQTNDEENVDE
jgi:serine/threonine protein phosphatase 1